MQVYKTFSLLMTVLCVENIICMRLTVRRLTHTSHIFKRSLLVIRITDKEKSGRIRNLEERSEYEVVKCHLLYVFRVFVTS